MRDSPELRTRLYGRANGRCECTTNACRHHLAGQRCPHDLGANWHVHQRSASGPITMDSVVAMCETCHQNIRTGVPG